MAHPLWTNIRELLRPRPPLEATLARLPFFADLTTRQLREVKRIVHVRTYDAGETIFEAGDVGVAMYVVMAGQVEIVLRRDPPEDDLKLARLGDGDLFGESALLDTAPRPATAIATLPTALAAIARPDWLDLIHRQPTIGVKMLLPLARMIAARLHVANRERDASGAAVQGGAEPDKDCRG